MDAGEAPGGSAGSADEGWADPQRDDLPGGLALDGFAQIGRGGSLDFADPALIWRRGSVSPGACATTSSNSCNSTCRPVLSA